MSQDSIPSSLGRLEAVLAKITTVTLLLVLRDVSMYDPSICAADVLWIMRDEGRIEFTKLDYSS